MEQITLETMNEEIKKLKERFAKLEEDLEFARRTEEAHDRIEAGEYISIDSDDLFEKMKKW